MITNAVGTEAKLRGDLICGPKRVVSIHDVAPATFDQCRRLLALCESSGVRTTLLVVPGPWRGQQIGEHLEFQRWLDCAAVHGHEISLHGWCHEASGLGNAPSPMGQLANRFLARGCGEFADVTRSEALSLIEKGLKALANIGHYPVGFTAPGWLLSNGARRALIDLGFAYTTTHLEVVDLQHNRALRMPALCQRPDSMLTPMGAWLVRRILVSRVVQGQPVRLALHPRDIEVESLQNVTHALIQVMGSGPTTTYAKLVDYFAVVR